MNDSPPTRGAEVTREKILDAALDIFAHKGYHDTRLDEIVSASGTSKGSIYFHFPNKERLFLALMDKFAHVLERRVREAIVAEVRGIARVEAALNAVLGVFGKYRIPAKVMLVQALGLGPVFEQKRRAILDQFADLVRTQLDEAIIQGDIPPCDTHMVAIAWIGAVNEVVMRWMLTGQPAQDHILRSLVPILLRSVGWETTRQDVS